MKPKTKLTASVRRTMSVGRAGCGRLSVTTLSRRSWWVRVGGRRSVPSGRGKASARTAARRPGG